MKFNTRFAICSRSYYRLNKRLINFFAFINIGSQAFPRNHRAFDSARFGERMYIHTYATAGIHVCSYSSRSPSHESLSKVYTSKRR